MSNANTVDLIKLSLISRPSGDVLAGTEHPAHNPYYGVDREPTSYYLGESYPVRATWLTGGLRDFDLTTARAPGDWPTTSAFAPGPVRI